MDTSRKNKLSDYGITLPDKKAGKLKGFIYPMIDDKVYEEKEKLVFKAGVSPHFKPSEDRQNVTRGRDPAYDEEPKSKIKLKPVVKEMTVKKNDTYNLAQELKKRKIKDFFVNQNIK